MFILLTTLLQITNRTQKPLQYLLSYIFLGINLAQFKYIVVNYFAYGKINIYPS